MEKLKRRNQIEPQPGIKLPLLTLHLSQNDYKITEGKQYLHLEFASGFTLEDENSLLCNLGFKITDEDLSIFDPDLTDYLRSQSLVKPQLSPQKHTPITKLLRRQNSESDDILPTRVKRTNLNGAESTNTCFSNNKI